MNHRAEDILVVRTGLKDVRWLTYILSEFVRIQSAKFQIVVSSDLSAFAERPCLNYDKDRLNALSLLQQDEVNVFSCEQAKHAILDPQSADLLRLAFLALSRMEEYDASKKGVSIQSYATRHPARDRTRFSKPWVNHLFDRLELLISEAFPMLKFGASIDPVIELSHDLDYIHKTIQLRGKQTAFNAFNVLRSFARPNQLPSAIGKTVSFFLSSPSYWCFDYWMDLERSAKKQSVFYVFAHAGQKGIKPWLLDPSYNVSTNNKLQQQFKAMLDKGFEIGLHGSFASATDQALLKKEKEILETAIDREVVKCRQHWLRYDETITPHAHSELFDYDSTVGWNDVMGFRAGCASVYRPFNHDEQRAFEHFVTPLVIMDSNIFDYGASQKEQLVSQGSELLRQLESIKNAHVSISWHPRTCSSDYQWHHVYEQYLRERC